MVCDGARCGAGQLESCHQQLLLAAQPLLLLPGCFPATLLWAAAKVGGGWRACRQVPACTQTACPSASGLFLSD